MYTERKENFSLMQGASEKKTNANGNQQTSDGDQPKKGETSARGSGKSQQKENVSEMYFVDLHYYSTLLGQSLSFAVTEPPFVRVLHVDGLHWVTVIGVHTSL